MADSAVLGTAPPRLGIAFVPSLPPERLRPLATAAEAAGLDELWVWEDCFKQSGVASAAAALAWTDRIRVGIGLLPVPLRNVALTAMELATLERMFPGRLIAGVGHGVQSWMDQVGARVASPLTLLREYTTALHQLLRGESVTMAGRYISLDQVVLDWPPTPAPPVMIGGAGPKSIAIAAELGDGNLLGAGLTNAEIQAACELAQRTSGNPAHPVVATHIVTTGPGSPARLDRELPRWGSLPGVGVGAAGDARAIADSIRQLCELGVTSVAVQPTIDEPDLEGLVHFIGTEVRPLLGRSPDGMPSDSRG